MRTRWKDYRQAAEISWVRKWQEAYAINEQGRERSQRKNAAEAASWFFLICVA